MALVIPVGFGVAAIELIGSPGTQPYITTIGVDLTAAGGDFVAAANTVHEAYETHIMPRTSDDLTLDRVTLAVGQDGPGGSVESSRPIVDGGSSGSRTPTAMSPVVRKITSQLGREGRGRMFLPGLLAETDVGEDGAIRPATMDIVDNLANLFLAFLLAGGTPSGPSTPGVLLHSRAELPPTPISAMRTASLVGWIRGRIR